MNPAKTLLLLLVAFPAYVHAQVVISEIAYDVSGSDSGREWVEVFNTGPAAAPLSEWRLFENGSNHTLTIFSGAESLAVGSYAILADNPSKFLEDVPGYSGPLFDSAFSLSNTGEALTLRCCASGDLLDKDSVSYAAEWGASGDGNTLHRTVSGTFVAGSPTPGTGVLVAQSGSAEESSTPSGGGGDAPSATILSLSIEGGSDRYLVSHAAAPFYALVLDEKKKEAVNVHVEWNFGDGTVEIGTRVSHAFAYPGRYAVTVSASHYDRRALDSFVVVVEDAKVTLAPFPDGSIAVENRSARDVDVSGWKLSDGTAVFEFPPNTRMLAGASLRVPKDTLKFFASERVRLYYQDGEPVPLFTELPQAPQMQEDTPEPRSARLAPARVASVSVPPPAADESAGAGDASESVLPVAAQSASAAPGWKFNSYIAGTAGIILVGIGAVFALSRARDGWTIIEETSDDA